MKSDGNAEARSPPNRAHSKSGGGEDAPEKDPSASKPARSRRGERRPRGGRADADAEAGAEDKPRFGGGARTSSGTHPGAEETHVKEKGPGVLGPPPELFLVNGRFRTAEEAARDAARAVREAEEAASAAERAAEEAERCEREAWEAERLANALLREAERRKRDDEAGNAEMERRRGVAA